MGFAWLLGVLGPLVMNGWGSGAVHGGGAWALFGGLSCPLDVIVGSAVRSVGVCLCPSMVYCSVYWAVCLSGVGCGA